MSDKSKRKKWRVDFETGHVTFESVIIETANDAIRHARRFAQNEKITGVVEVCVRRKDAK